MEQSYLYVRMFGGLSIEVNKKAVRLSLDIHSITVQLLILLWSAGEKGIQKDILINHLYDEKDITDTANSMRVNIFRVRKLVGKLGLPDHNYIVAECGVYRWDSGEVCFCTDVGQFAEFIKQASYNPGGGQKSALLKQACGLYKGEFLPELAAEQWVAVRAMDYQELYMNAVAQLHYIYMEEKRYEDAAAIAERALKSYPYEKFAIMAIDTYVAQGHLQKALDTLDSISQFMFKDMGVAPSEDMLNRYEAISKRIGSSYTALKSIKEQLKEDVVKGAYYCTYPSFVDCYRVLNRLAVRSGQTIFLLNCRMTDSQGQLLENGDKRIKKISELLTEAMEHSLRSGDVYTKSNDNQFLILLSGPTLEECDVVVNRIEGRFRKAGDIRGIRLDFRISSALYIKD